MIEKHKYSAAYSHNHFTQLLLRLLAFVFLVSVFSSGCYYRDPYYKFYTKGLEMDNKRMNQKMADCNPTDRDLANKNTMNVKLKSLNCPDNKFQIQSDSFLLNFEESFSQSDPVN